MSLASRISGISSVIPFAARLGALMVIPLCAQSAHASATGWFMTGASFYGLGGASGGQIQYPVGMQWSGFNGSNLDGIKVFGTAGPIVGEQIFSDTLFLQIDGSTFHSVGEALGVQTDVDLNISVSAGTVRIVSARTTYDEFVDNPVEQEIVYPGGLLLGGDGHYTESFLTPTTPGTFDSGSWSFLLAFQWTGYSFDSELSISVPQNSIDLHQTVVPTPGAIAVLALGGLTATRRRRH